MLNIKKIIESQKFNMDTEISEVLVKINVDYIDNVFLEYEVSKIKGDGRIENIESLNNMLTSYIMNKTPLDSYLNDIINESIEDIKDGLIETWMSSTTIRDILVDRITYLVASDSLSWNLDFDIKTETIRVKHPQE